MKIDYRAGHSQENSCQTSEAMALTEISSPDDLLMFSSICIVFY